MKYWEHKKRLEKIQSYPGQFTMNEATDFISEILDGYYDLEVLKEEVKDLKTSNEDLENVIEDLKKEKDELEDKVAELESELWEIRGN